MNRSERILSPEYTYFTSTGGLSDKTATLAFLTDTSVLSEHCANRPPAAPETA